jgi:two-component system, sensor histidine kinase and response regulator
MPEMDYRRFPILYVDDEPHNLTVFRRCFAETFTVFTASSGSEALELLAHQDVAVLIADQRMPEMSGVTLAETVKEQFPSVMRILMTAYADYDAVVDSVNLGEVYRYIQKPWDRALLGETLRGAIENHVMTSTLANLRTRLAHGDRLAVASAPVLDLRNPLHALSGGLCLLETSFEELLEGEAAKALGQRGRSELIEKLQFCHSTLSKVMAEVEQFEEHAGSNSAKRQRVNLLEVANHVLRLARPELLRKAKVDLDVPEEPLQVIGDPMRLSQVLSNLLINAAQAIPPGQPSRHRICLSILNDTDWVVLTVSDNGRGIPRADLPHIFDTFYTSKSDNGMGLGLAIVREAVEDHCGLIDVESDAGKGARFMVRLPVAPPKLSVLQ